MNVVVIGDVGWRYLYYLGDEAMTEAAVDMLKSRGVDGITLTAGEPDVAQDFYGLPAVRRVRFKASWSRGRNEWRLKDVARVLKEQDWDDNPIYEAIRDADAVLIAGGGNMNSRDYHQLFERVAAKRIAEHFGVPLYVSSQTVGPMLTPEDRALVVEIADYAQAFGCREATTAALMRAHVARPDRVHQTLDDAVMLRADAEATNVVAELAGGNRYVVASFTDHRGTIWESNTAYRQDIAALCAQIAERLDVDVLLVPHAGSMDTSKMGRDQKSNIEIEELAGSSRVRATRMVTAREDVALIENSVLSLSTRYHPLIFSTASATPAVAIAPSYYSSVRMRGAMRNVGFERFVLPTSSMHLVAVAVAEAAQRSGELQDALDTSRTNALEFQTAWWDALVDAMKSGNVVEFGERLEADSYEPREPWSQTNEAIVPVFDKYAQQVDEARSLAKALATERAKSDRLATDLASTRATVEQLKNRKVLRVADRVGLVFSRR